MNDKISLSVTKNSAVIALIFLLFLVVRLFSGYPYYALNGDECSYLTLARNFPLHKLFNNDIFLIHSPLYPYTIALLSAVMPLFQAGLIDSLLCGALNFFVLLHLGRVLRLSALGSALAALYLSLSSCAIVFDTHVTRIPLLLLFSNLTLFAWIKYLDDLPDERRFPRMTLIYGMLTVALSDQGLAVVAAVLLIFLIKENTCSRKTLFALFSGFACAYALWPLVRLYFYLKFATYPAGIDGTIEFLKPIRLKTLLQPNFLPFTKFHRGFFGVNDWDWRELKPLKFFKMPFALGGVSKWLAWVSIGSCLAASLWRGIYKKERDVLFLWAVSLLMLLPYLFGMNFWYGLGYLTPFALLLGKGGETLLLSEKNKVLGLQCVGLLALGICAYWLWPGATGTFHDLLPERGHHFLFARPPLTRGKEFTKEILEKLPEGALMAPVGLTPEISWLSPRPVVALPFDPGYLDDFIYEYKISYLVFTEEQLTHDRDFAFNEVTNKTVARYIQKHPEKYPLRHTFDEKYPAIYPPDRFYVYQLR